MSNDKAIAEIEARHAVRSMATGRNHGHMSEMDAVEAHKDCAALLSIVKRQQSDHDARKEIVKAAVRALDAAGWVCVPKVATEEMEECGWIDKEDVTPSEIYGRMLDAAPKLVEVKLEAEG